MRGNIDILRDILLYTGLSKIEDTMPKYLPCVITDSIREIQSQNSPSRWKFIFGGAKTFFGSLNIHD